MTKILHTDAFTQRDAYIPGCFYTRVLLHRDVFHKDTHTQTFTHTDAFIRKCFYAQLPLRRGAVTQVLRTHSQLHMYHICITFMYYISCILYSRFKISFYVNKVLRAYNICP